MKYKIKLAQFWIPKYGIFQTQAVDVDSETIRLSGLRAQKLLAFLLFPCAFALNRIIGAMVGFNLKLIPLIILCSAVLLILYYRWKSFIDAPVLVEKELLEVRQFIENSFNNYQRRKILLSSSDLSYISLYEDKMYLSGVFSQFIEQSRETRKRKTRQD